MPSLESLEDFLVLYILTDLTIGVFIDGEERVVDLSMRFWGFGLGCKCLVWE